MNTEPHLNTMKDYDARRQQAGVSAFRLCMLAGISYTTWWRLTTGRCKQPRRAVTAKLEAALQRIEQGGAEGRP